MAKTTKSSSTKRERKSKKTVEEKPVEEAPVEETPTEEAPVEETPAEESTSETETPTEERKSRTRRVVNRDTVLESLDGIVTRLSTELENVKDSKERVSNKFLRSLLKELKQVKTDSSRVMKMKKTTNRVKNTSSGFLKPVQISKDMAKFTGWEPDVPRSRVDVTKYICDYVKQKELQNPDDRRIINPDKKLRKLLNIDGNDSEPLRYYSLQKKIQHHFTN